jgi:hypothetical protein
VGEQRPKSGAHAQVDARERTRARSEDGLDAPEPTYSEARPRLPDQERTSAREQNAEADTKVERRASVRPSAFGVPRKSVAPASNGPHHDASGPDARLEPHERVLEAARLLDALGPALLDGGEADLYTHGVREPVQRLANERARGVDHLVEREAYAEHQATTAPAAAVASTAPTSAHASLSSSRADPRASTAARAQAVKASAAPPSSAPAVGARIVRRPWLSLLLFGGMVALSVVPLLRYAQSAETNAAPSQREPARAATLSIGAPAAEPQPSLAGARTRALRPMSAATEPATIDSKPVALDRERAIATALSEGTHALDGGDISLAERMFGQVIELAEDNPHAAYGLARIRLRQNNLAGAEGWIQSALRRRPRRAAYHQLYAEVLTRMGRITEARQEQSRAERREEGAHSGRDEEP